MHTRVALPPCESDEHRSDAPTRAKDDVDGDGDGEAEGIVVENVDGEEKDNVSHPTD